jgi:hypothetical protein
MGLIHKLLNLLKSKTYIYVPNRLAEMLRLAYTPTEANDERLRHDLSRTEQRKLDLKPSLKEAR